MCRYTEIVELVDERLSSYAIGIGTVCYTSHSLAITENEGNRSLQDSADPTGTNLLTPLDAIERQ
jgi:hypothetical protein